MGQRFDALTAEHIRFIEAQHLFFVGTAASGGRVNVSPKGMDSLRVLGPTRLLWLNLTGSGNETAAHVAVDPRMTLLFCAFEGRPQILRVYGTARGVALGAPGWEGLVRHFEPLPGARQIFDLTVDLVQTSCGMAVPRYAFAGERRELAAWARRKGEAGLRRYWERKNRRSLDGLAAPIPGIPPPAPGAP